MGNILNKNQRGLHWQESQPASLRKRKKDDEPSYNMMILFPKGSSIIRQER
jgi:hypothetical protein